jgi:hypothetical protein
MSTLEKIPDETFMNYIKFVKKFLELKNINPNEMDFMSEFAPDIDEIKNKIFGPLKITRPSIHDYEYLYIYLTTGQRPTSMNTYSVSAHQVFTIKKKYQYEIEVSSYFNSNYFTEEYVDELNQNEFIDLFTDPYDVVEDTYPRLIDQEIDDITEL